MNTKIDPAALQRLRHPYNITTVQIWANINLKLKQKSEIRLTADPAVRPQKRTSLQIMF